MKQVNKAIVAAVGIAGVVVGGLVGAFVMPNDNPVEIQYQDKIVEVPVEVEKIVNNTIEIEVPVGSENLDLVLDEIYNNNGNVDYLVDDLDDDELDQVVDRIVFANDIKDLAVAEVKAELFDELDREMVGLVELDERDLERLKVDDDADEVTLANVDYEDKDAEVTVTGTFEQDDVKYDYEAMVEIKDGIVDDFEVVSVAVA